MQNDMKYEYKIKGNSLSFRAEEQERFTRCSRKNLGWYYDPERIKKRIERQVRKRSSDITKESGFYHVHDENAVGLNRWVALKNMQEASRLLNMLSDYSIGSTEQLEEKISEHYDQKFDMIKELNSYEVSIREQRELLKMLNTYWENKSVHDEFLKSGAKKNFKDEHSRELEIYETSKEWLRNRYGGTSLPNRAVLEMKISEQENKREAMLEKYHNLKKSIDSLEKAKERLDKYLKIEQQEQKKIKGELE